MVTLWFISHIFFYCRPTMSAGNTITNWEVLLCPSLHTLEGRCREILFEAQGQHALLTLPGWFLWVSRLFSKKSKKSLRFCSLQEQFLVQANPVRLKTVILKSHKFFNPVVVKFMKRNWGREWDETERSQSPVVEGPEQNNDTWSRYST